MSDLVACSARYAHEASSSLISSDPEVVQTTLNKIKMTLEIDNTDTFRSMLIKRDVVKLVMNLVVMHSNSVTSTVSKDILQVSLQVLAMVLRNDVEASEMVFRDFGQKIFLQLLKSFVKISNTSVPICTILQCLADFEKPRGHCAKTCGGVELLATLCAKNGKKVDVQEASLRLLHVYCKSYGVNADALVRNPNLSEIVRLGTRNASYRGIASSLLGLSLTLSGRSEKACAQLGKANVAAFLLQVIELYPEDFEMVNRSLMIFLRMGSEKTTKQCIIAHKAFSKLHPLLSLHLGKDQLLQKLCTLLWKFYWIESDSLRSKDLNHFHVLKHPRAETDNDRENNNNKDDDEDVEEWDKRKLPVFSSIYSYGEVSKTSDEVQMIRKCVLEEDRIPTGRMFDTIHTLDHSKGRELLYRSESSNQRLDALLDIVERLKYCSNYNVEPKCIYNPLLEYHPPFYRTHDDNYDDNNTSRAEMKVPSALRFESRFESGNLARVDLVCENVYNLTLQADTNSFGQVQWFYFAIHGMEKGVDYQFNFLNLEKVDSLYNQGMRPLMFCPQTAITKKIGWVRSGKDICYFPNPFNKHSTVKGAGNNHGKKQVQCYSAVMNITLPDCFICSPDEPVFFAYCFPYSYRQLRRDLAVLTRRKNVVRQTSLCKSLAGNDCPLLTITNFQYTTNSPPYEEEKGEDDDKNDDSNNNNKLQQEQQKGGNWVPLAERQHVVLSARVHPGETNSSWVMKGALDFLTSDNPTARKLRDRLVFKVVPMLNPDGVIVGNSRCSLVGLDLNRQWSQEDSMAPTVFHLQKMMANLQREQPGTIRLYVDIHGHSRKPGIFLYGCEDPKSYFGTPEQIFPHLLADTSPSDLFSLERCQFKVSKAKANCARVVAWRELKIVNSFTLEASMSGNETHHFEITDFMSMGEALGHAVWDLVDPSQVKLGQVKTLLEQKFPSRFLSSKLKSNSTEPQSPDGTKDDAEERQESSTKTKRIRRQRVSKDKKTSRIRKTTSTSSFATSLGKPKKTRSKAKTSSPV